MLIENSITTPQPLLTLFACPSKFIIIQDIAREKGFPFHLSSHAIEFMCFDVTLILTQLPQQTIVGQDRLIIEVGSCAASEQACVVGNRQFAKSHNDTGVKDP